jgi:carbon-monoxide dehydrogenase medium subunit
VKPAAFDYVAAGSLDEAVAALAEHGDEAKVLAGGQSLVPMMAFRLATPPVLVDLNGASELEYARIDGDTLVLGALARHRDVQDLPELRRRCPLIAEAVDVIGHPAIRNRGTVGGSLAHADPSAEWPGVLVALGGEADAVGPNGRRTISAPDLFETYFTPTVAPDEVLAEVRLPLPTGPGVGSCFVEFARRHGDFALAGVGAVLTMEGGMVREVRVALIGVRDTPVRSAAAEAVLRGAEPTDEAFDQAASAVDAEIDPVSDVHGSADYRRHLARVLMGRALRVARSRITDGAAGA